MSHSAEIQVSDPIVIGNDKNDDVDFIIGTGAQVNEKAEVLDVYNKIIQDAQNEIKSKERVMKEMEETAIDINDKKSDVKENDNQNIYICSSCNSDIFIPTSQTPKTIGCSNCPAVCKVKFLVHKTNCAASQLTPSTESKSKNNPSPLDESKFIVKRIKYSEK